MKTAYEKKKSAVVLGPPIPKYACFEKKSTATGQMIVNEIGSVHVSYTAARERDRSSVEFDQNGDGMGIAMLLLWSGCAANIPTSKVYCADPQLRMVLNQTMKMTQ